MANVMFLFKREGRVRVALDAAGDVEARMERLAEIALDAGAEDFEAEDLADGSRTVEVCHDVSSAYLPCAVS